MGFKGVKKVKHGGIRPFCQAFTAAPDLHSHHQRWVYAALLLFVAC
jgi:hypothetical protein